MAKAPLTPRQPLDLASELPTVILHLSSRPLPRPTRAPQRAVWLVATFITCLGVAFSAHATGFKDLGDDLAPSEGGLFDIKLDLRLRGELLHNLDLDHGYTPSGEPLFAVPAADPSSQNLTHADMRLRTDLAFVAPGGGIGVKMRLHFLDNLALGSTPDGPPLATKSQRSPDNAVTIKRAYGEALTPIGLISAGRIGADWGLGMLANGGDCDECDTADAADRIAFVTPLFGHIFAASYDFNHIGPRVQRKDQVRTIDLDPSDDVRTVNVAVLHYTDPIGLERRANAGKATFDYGAYISHQWQENDIPSTYLSGLPPGVVARGYTATAFDAWLRLTLPWGRVEVEAAYLTGNIEQATLDSGMLLHRPITTNTFGVAFESEFGVDTFPLSGGLNFGFAGGDKSPGFGAFPGLSRTAQPGDLDGLQFDYPRDTTVDNFTFHPNYHIDRILFREIIGAVTDAVYLRPHLQWRVFDLGPSRLTASLAAVFSMAVYPESTPGGERPLGLELDPTLTYEATDGFKVAAEYAVLFPFSGLDNVLMGMKAKPAQLLRFRLHFAF